MTSYYNINAKLPTAPAITNDSANFTLSAEPVYVAVLDDPVLDPAVLPEAGEPAEPAGPAGEIGGIIEL